MKKWIIVSAVLFASCELDQFDPPSATIHGSLKDVNGGALIQQDIEAGSKIIYREYGYQNPEEQQMIFKETGEYRNNLVFPGQYDIYFNESNFVKPDTLKSYTIKSGDNILDFTVQPYIRVSNVTIAKSGNEIVATFTITPTVANNVKQIGLFGHIDRIVGNQFAVQRATQNIDAASKDVPKTYTLKFSTNGFTAGKTYYFRVGALIDVANAKYNYAPSVTITI
ncbi:DUF3823 domain-containing protein [Chitinophaga sp. SYP-B3965]|uniref:DUF3823 domain-containing protein n=1 Tax=Chitinophaga sp. SYP-B3965 TaxID=2663120 RepID=UPI001299BD4C|nr:DUF3823 domain-containing protein [Chitinophaga sp. SYP-B3965]MRG45278.1 DUF3823 domain-containing protein [Chitinophaga sp. SYP-B3965]